MVGLLADWLVTIFALGDQADADFTRTWPPLELTPAVFHCGLFQMRALTDTPLGEGSPHEGGLESSNSDAKILKATYVNGCGPNSR